MCTATGVFAWKSGPMRPRKVRRMRRSRPKKIFVLPMWL
ncbi:hypothetical protein EVA_06537 [gut metagenome]|uniref:Uncharacterized protein n=1 Tax=gut metagenome TaxID=749906 RepID=J9GDD8_9ZZZZ